MQIRARIPSLLAACLALVLLAAFPASVSGTVTVRPPHYETSGGNENPPHVDGRDGGHVFPFLRWLRDSAVEIVFGRPDGSGRGSGRSRGGAKDGATRFYGGARQSRYKDNVVVRFNVTGSKEEAALSEAADRLFLDIWGFTDEHVDVRLLRDDIPALMTLLPAEMQPSVLIHDVAAAAIATYPSHRPKKTIPGSDWFGSPVTETTTDGVDNIFFQDYQPLSVCHLGSHITLGCGLT